MASATDAGTPSDPVSGPYWAGAHAGQLVLQRCADCTVIRHYPQPMCPRCHSFAVEWVDSPGFGTVHSWTVTHHAFDPSLTDQVPYALVTVDLPEGVRLLARFDDLESLQLNLPVQVTFENHRDGDRPVPVAIRVVGDEGQPRSL